jgi:hypothetical protein
MTSWGLVTAYLERSNKMDIYYLRFSRLCLRRMPSSGLFRHVALVGTDVTANVVSSSLIFVTLMMGAFSSPNRRFLQEPHGVTSQKTAFVIFLNILNICAKFRIWGLTQYKVYNSVTLLKKQLQCLLLFILSVQTISTDRNRMGTNLGITCPSVKTRTTHVTANG